MKRLLCLLLGHKWESWFDEGFFIGASPGITSTCTRCGKTIHKEGAI